MNSCKKGVSYLEATRIIHHFQYIVQSEDLIILEQQMNVLFATERLEKSPGPNISIT